MGSSQGGRLFYVVPKRSCEHIDRESLCGGKRSAHEVWVRSGLSVFLFRNKNVCVCFVFLVVFTNNVACAMIGILSEMCYYLFDRILDGRRNAVAPS